MACHSAFGASYRDHLGARIRIKNRRIGRIYPPTPASPSQGTTRFVKFRVSLPGGFSTACESPHTRTHPMAYIRRTSNDPTKNHHQILRNTISRQTATNTSTHHGTPTIIDQRRAANNGDHQISRKRDSTITSGSPDSQNGQRCCTVVKLLSSWYDLAANGHRRVCALTNVPSLLE